MSKRAAFNWLITAAAGLIASLFAMRMCGTFAQFRLPLFFPPIWLIYLGWAAALICLAGAYSALGDAKAAKAFYVALGLLVCWSALFFRADAHLAAAAAGMAFTGVLLRLRRLAETPGLGKRFVPCCVWAGYMAYLNLGICLMN